VNKVKVQLIGQDSNVFNLLGLCMRAMKRAGQIAEAEELRRKVMNDCSSYDEALQAMMEACDVE
jgi:hypothetical protein